MNFELNNLNISNMKSKSALNVRSLIMIMIVFSQVFYVAVWSQDKPSAASLSGPVLLRYSFPPSKSIRYLSSSKMVQTMDINGQSMDVNITGAFGCTVKSAGTEGNNLRLEVVVDTLAQSTESPMGSSGGPVTDVTGKSFSVIIAPNGKSVDFSEAEKIVYNIEGSGESNLTTTLNSFFPVLPANPVRPGEIWNYSDTVRTTTKSMTGTTVVNSVSKIDSLYEFDGIEWARIRSKISGTEEVNVQSQGMDIKMAGPFEGTSEVLFAIKLAYFVKQTVITKMTGNIEMSQPDVMKFPVVMNVTSTIDMLEESAKME